MNRVTRAFLDGVMAGIISAGGAIMTAVVSLPNTISVSEIGSVTWMAGGLAGLVSAVKGWRSYLKDPDTGTKKE